MDIQYQRGNFHTLYAKMKVRVGGQHNVTVEKGDEIQYDGMILKYAGMELPLGPSMRSSIKQGWFTDDMEDIDSGVSAVVPDRDVAKSQTKNTDLSRVQRRGADNAMETDNSDEDTVMHVSDRRPGAAPDKHHPGGRNLRAEPVKVVKKGWKSSGLVINPDTIDEQDGVTVARLRTAAKHKPIDMYSREAGMEKQRLENLSGSGAIPVRQRQREDVIEREGVTIRTTGKMNRNAPIDIAEESDGEVVAQVNHRSKRASTGNNSGITIRDTSNIRAEKAAAASSAKVKIDTKLDPKIRMARRIYPDFPSDWSFTGKLKDRMDAVKKHGASPEFLEALYAAEGDQFRKLLTKTYPKQFAG
jgi:hypothetical protein